MSMVLLVMILVSLFVMNKFDPEYSKEVENWKISLENYIFHLYFIFIYAPIFCSNTIFI